MSTPDYLPPLLQPPHDPTSWLLDNGEGWQEANLHLIEKNPLNGTLSLTPKLDSIPSLTSIDGSFGGLTLPANVAISADGTILLLDAAALKLKRFDPCLCTFTAIPGLGGEGSGARQWHNPHGIGIGSGNLYVCDAGNSRLSVFSAYGWVTRGHWRPPQASLPQPFQPFGISVDSRGRVFVSDTANSCIHRFGRHGHWEASFSGFGTPTYLTIDCQDRLYAVIAGIDRKVQILAVDGNTIGSTDRVAPLIPLFPAQAFIVDADGNLHLGPLCASASADSGVFDLQGNPVATPTPPAIIAYEKQGLYYSRALDSELYRCQWHRVILNGQIPSGTQVEISTYTAETLLTADQIQTAELAWATQQNAGVLSDGEWDCLVGSGGGRYLWLRMKMIGNGKTTPQLSRIVIEFPRISLRRYLPAVFGMEPISTDFTDRFLSLFDTGLRSIETTLDQQARYFDPLSTPATRDPKTGLDFLTWLASWIGVSLDRHWPEAKQRLLLKRAAKLYDLRGTREGLWRQLLLLLDMEANTHQCPEERPKYRCQARPANCAPQLTTATAWQPPPLILEHYQLRRWLFVGAGRLGDQAVLWGQRIVNRSQLNAGAQVGQTQLKTAQDPYRDPFHVYAHQFTLFLPARFRNSDTVRKALENLLAAESPAHTQYHIEYVEPGFRVGMQSMIGFDTVIGRTKHDITLDETTLGTASLPGGPPYAQGEPSFLIGKEGRLGVTTRLA